MKLHLCQIVLPSAASALVAERPQTIRVLGDCYFALAIPIVQLCATNCPLLPRIESQHCCCGVRPAGSEQRGGPDGSACRTTGFWLTGDRHISVPVALLVSQHLARNAWCATSFGRGFERAVAANCGQTRGTTYPCLGLAVWKGNPRVCVLSQQLPLRGSGAARIFLPLDRHPYTTI